MECNKAVENKFYCKYCHCDLFQSTVTYHIPFYKVKSLLHTHSPLGIYLLCLSRTKLYKASSSSFVYLSLALKFLGGISCFHLAIFMIIISWSADTQGDRGACESRRLFRLLFHSRRLKQKPERLVKSVTLMDYRHDRFS